MTIMKDKKAKAKKTNKTHRYAIGAQRFELIVKLFLFKYSFYPKIAIISLQNTNIIQNMFSGRMNQIKSQMSNSFIADCKRITEINLLIINDRESFEKHKPELTKALKIEPEYLVPYKLAPGVDESKELSILEREKLLFQLAIAIAKFDINKDFTQHVELEFNGTTYFITPSQVIHDLNYLPLIEDMYNNIENSYADKKSIIMYEFEKRLTFLLWKFRRFIKADLRNPIDLSSAIMPEDITSLNSIHDFHKPNEPVMQKIAQSKLSQSMSIDDFISIQPHFKPTLPDTDSAELKAMLSFACFPEHFDRIHQFVLTPEIVKKYGELMLKSACYTNNMKVVKRLLELKVDPNFKQKSQAPALLCAAMGGNIVICQLLIDHGASIKNSMYNNFHIYDIALLAENYALAVYFDRKHPFQKHFDKNYDVLSISMATRNLHAIRNLTEHFGCVPTSDHLQIAVSHEQFKVFEMLLPKVPSQQLKLSLLVFCALNNFTTQTQLLLNRGMTAHALDPLGFSLLSMTISSGFVAIAELLLLNHADPNFIDATEIPNLVHATILGSKRIVSALIRAGATTKLNYNNETLLEIALKYKHVNLALFYLRGGYFSPNHCTESGKTIFEIIIESLPDLALIKACLASENIILTTADGQSLLTLALIEQCDITIITELMSADVNTSNYSLVELIELHPDSEALAKLFQFKPREEAKSIHPTIANNRFLFLCHSENIPPKDWRQFTEHTENPAEKLKEYQDKREKLILELNQLHKIIQEKHPMEAFNLDEMSRLKASGPNRALQTRIERLQSLLTKAPAPQNIFHEIAKISSDGFKAEIRLENYLRSEIPYNNLVSILGLTPVANNNRYALVTQQLDTLIPDFSDDLLAPFKHILAAPCINPKNGLKNIRARHATASIQIDGEEIKLEVTHYLKARNKDRILVAEIFPNNGGIILLVPIKWLRNGFHDDRYSGITHFNGGHAVTMLEHNLISK